MNEIMKNHYMELYENKRYSEALQFLIKHTSISHDMTIAELADHYATFRQFLPSEDVKGLARIVVREITGQHKAEVSFGR